MDSKKLKVIKYIGQSKSKIKYPVEKTISGTVIKSDAPYLRIKPEIGRIVEIAKSAITSVKNK
ncbi:hypothetical protein [Lysinibacillus fusiformis]|uniref:hypothetical protein n=1 Tax=Lysinibacillus fusiformis TaxID=28031 RepID=UPI0020BD50F6|nr:hypothetical protein [Lysinibacillus fusiformis]